MRENPFVIGDVVILNSGGPKMTVVETEASQVRVAWVDDEDRLEGAWFPHACVFRVHVTSGVGAA
jgi:uncharacterized protein YodC (DUF2158 family)